MTRQTKESQPQPDDHENSGPPDVQRRRLLRAGVSSSLLLTIASRPAWAQNGGCTASALASANASGGCEVDGLSISAGWWKQKKDKWPYPATSYTPFHNYFNAIKIEVDVKNKKSRGKAEISENVLYHGLTLGEVIDLNGGGDPAPGGGTFGFHLIGALMNAMTFPPDRGAIGFAFTTREIIDLYNALDRKDAAQFSALKATLEFANDQFDATTGKPK